MLGVTTRFISFQRYNIRLFTATAFTYPKITKTALLAYLRLGQVATENALRLLAPITWYKLKYPSITRRVVYSHYIDFGFLGSPYL